MGFRRRRPEGVYLPGKIRVSGDQAGAHPVHGRRFRGPGVFDDLHIEGGEVGLHHLLVLGMEPGGKKDALSRLVDLPGHEDGFGQGRGHVVVRGVDHSHAQELSGHALVFEYRLQGALGNLGLVGGIGREEFSPGSQGWH